MPFDGIKSRRDVCQEVTDKIIASLEAGVRPWSQPWSAQPGSAHALPLRSNGKPYRGVNIILLWMTAAANGYKSRHWFTFKQAQELKAHVRKGERGTLVVYRDTFTKTVTDANGEDIEKDIPFVGGYTVFNADQIDGLPAEYYGKDELVAAPARDERCEAFFNATGADIRHGGTRAFYNPGGDFIQMPPAAAFKSMDRYYGTLAHEAIHWTAHTKRLDRKFGARFGDNAYAAEEMVAEIGAAFWCAMMGIATDESIRDDHAAYVGSWIATLKNDRKAIFTAASKASAAIEYLDKPVA